MNNDKICNRFLYPTIPITVNESLPILLRAFEKTIVLAQSLNNSATIICPAKNAFKRLMVNILRPKIINILLSGNPAEIINNVFMKLESTGSVDRNMLADIVFCLYAREDMLEKIDRRNVTSIVVAPATKEAFDYWNKIWSPQIEE